MSAPNNEPIHPCAEGMTGFKGLRLRDYFAALAMQSIIRNFKGGHGITHDDMAIEAYLAADAMLKRQQQKD